MKKRPHKAPRKYPSNTLLFLSIIGIVALMAVIFLLTQGGEVFDKANTSEEKKDANASYEEPRHDLPSKQEQVTSYKPDIYNLEWKENGHWFKYARCMGLTSKDVSYCKNLGDKGQKRCKDSILIYKTLKRKNMTHLAYMNGSPRYFIAKSLLKEEQYCSRIEQEGYAKMCDLILNKEKHDCNKTLGNNTYGCDLLNTIDAYTSGEKSYCQNITKDMWTKTKCLMLTARGPDYCRKKLLSQGGLNEGLVNNTTWDEGDEQISYTECIDSNSKPQRHCRKKVLQQIQ